MIILHLFLVLDRLGRAAREAGPEAGAEAARLARCLSEAFVTDVDDSLREMGVGDLSVPKKVKRAAAALGERCAAYQTAMAAPEAESALAAELAGTIPGLKEPRALARYTKAARETLATVADQDLLGGALRFPDAHFPDEAKLA